MSTHAKGHSSSVYSVAFSHESTRLASASGDWTVKIWELSSGMHLQTLKTDRVPQTMLFDTAGLYLRTDVGNFTISASSASSSLDGMKSPQAQHQAVGISADKSWITYNDQDVLWLPSEYRPACFAVSGSKVGIGVGSGRVWLCDLSP